MRINKKLIILCTIFSIIHYSSLAFGDISSLFQKGTSQTAGGVCLPSFSEIAEKATPAVVNIFTTQKASNKRRPMNGLDDPRDILRDWLEGDRFPDKKRPMSLGSGFIFDPEGYIVTNFHVIDGAEEVNITLNNSAKVYKAKIVGKDPKTDIAVLKIDTKERLPYIIFGDSDKAKVGDWVIAIGNAFGLGETVTTGIISAKARYIDINAFDDLIQTDAAINMGNSGGPMLNMAGEVIGVNSAILSPPGSGGGNVGIGFAVPSAVVQSVVKQLREKGEVVRGWLGVMVQTMTPNIAEGLGMQGEPKGALVSSVVKGSPAQKAGIHVGDVIVKFNNRDVPSMHKLPRMVGEVDIGAKVPVEILRDGKAKILNVTIEKPVGDQASNDDDSEVKDSLSEKTLLGMGVQDMNKELRKFYDIDESATGVIVVHVERASVAALAGIKPGDIIIQINGKSVTSANELISLFNKMKKSGKNSAALLLARDGKTFFVGIETSGIK